MADKCAWTSGIAITWHFIENTLEITLHLSNRKTISKQANSETPTSNPSPQSNPNRRRTLDSNNKGGEWGNWREGEESSRKMENIFKQRDNNYM